MIFLASVVLFHFGNAAMLPMAGQVLAKTHPGADIIALSACIITAQLVMIGVAASVGWAMRRGVGRKTIFLVAFVTLPIRGFLFTLTDSPLGVVAIQLLVVFQTRAMILQFSNFSSLNGFIFPFRAVAPNQSGRPFYRSG
jgi:hypothetical protein